MKEFQNRLTVVEVITKFDTTFFSETQCTHITEHHINTQTHHP